MHASNTEESPREGDKLSNYLTMVGHICSDINQGAISAVLPFLVVSYGYDYAAVALLVFAANIASAVIQPLFGIIGDKRSCPWLMALGVFLAGLGMCLIGFVDRLRRSTVLAAMLSGIGVAMFHPEGGRLANLAAGEHKGDGMSIFAVGGNIGFFLGPLMVAFFLSAFGMHGTLRVPFPGYGLRGAPALLQPTFPGTGNTCSQRRQPAATARRATNAGEPSPPSWGCCPRAPSWSMGCSRSSRCSLWA